MSMIGYLRVSTSEQSTEAQKHSIAERYNVDKWFTDDAISGSTKAMERPGFIALAAYAREGDTIIVQAIDRLGRNTIDVLETVERLNEKGCIIISMREGFDLSKPVGKAMLTMLAAVGELERSNIKERQLAGIKNARAQGQQLGRPQKSDPTEVVRWRADNSASISATAKHFSISTATVKRALASVRKDV